jgi:hypothetical protein
MKRLRAILCAIGWHDWERGKGWIPVKNMNGTEVYVDGWKCRDCEKTKQAAPEPTK